ncbi:MAG: hypothetical protein JWO36_5351 [Myxococcales bacterium]|nr:hypothetical protein [Myxococcales bacterium]
MWSTFPNRGCKPRRDGLQVERVLQTIPGMILRAICIAVIGLLGCRGAETTHGTTNESGSAATESATAGGAATGGAATGSAATGSGSAGSGSEYVPAEFKSGMARWKDTVVYLDGDPIGYLTFGELPVTLKPTWIKSKVSQNKPPGCDKCLAWKWGEQRSYKFTDYLKAMGINIQKIRQMHVQGPKQTDTIVVTAKDLLEPKANDFLFRFGGEASGKAIPHVPSKFGNGMGPDKITSVMIYVTKAPPTFDEVGYVLDGVPIDGVPYHGEPLRGGVRIYLDDKLAAIIKRQELDVKHAKTMSDGQLSWGLYDFLKSKGIDSSKIVEGYVIRDERRKEKLPAAELEKLWFQASSQAGGSVLLGDQKVVANVIALHTRALKPEELPQVRPEEEE